MSTKLYVEGGGDSKALRTACRKGFRKLLEKAGLGGRMPRIVACGGRKAAYDDFVTSLRTGDCVPMLLVDAEGPALAAKPWEHLRARDQWTRPEGAADEQCHLMVQVMESWFLADREALATFYGQGFKRAALPKNPMIEQVPKQDVMRALANATGETRKGSYSKGAHSFDVLAALDPRRVEDASPHAKRLLDALREP